MLSFLAALSRHIRYIFPYSFFTRPSLRWFFILPTAGTKPECWTGFYPFYALRMFSSQPFIDSDVIAAFYIRETTEEV